MWMGRFLEIYAFELKTRLLGDQMADELVIRPAYLAKKGLVRVRRLVGGKGEGVVDES